jgi:hypothetical protein
MKLAEMLSIGGTEKSYDGRMGYFNTLMRRRVFDVMDSLGIIMPGEPAIEPLKKQNLLLLSPGAHGGITFSAAAGTGPLVTVSGGTTVFRGCTFEKPGDDTASQVSVASGPKAILLGCVFRGSGTTASRVVDHPVGAATDVQVAFCYNKTGNTLGNAADIPQRNCGRIAPLAMDGDPQPGRSGHQRHHPD